MIIERLLLSNLYCENEKKNVGEGIRWVGGQVDGCELRIEAIVKM